MELKPQKCCLLFVFFNIDATFFMFDFFAAFVYTHSNAQIDTMFTIYTFARVDIINIYKFLLDAAPCNVGSIQIIIMYRRQRVRQQICCECRYPLFYFFILLCFRFRNVCYLILTLSQVHTATTHNLAIRQWPI